MKANYVIYHPERQSVPVKATALTNNNNILENWEGNIFVDWIKDYQGNQDPYVFNNPWLYSYCKTPNLRRVPRKDGNFIQNSSTIIFVDGNQAEEGRLLVDTVFIVGGVCPWRSKKSLIPEKYSQHQDNIKSSLWNSHFKYGVESSGVYQHPGFITYEAALYDGQQSYSFLPYRDGQLVSIGFDELSIPLSVLLKSKIKGKYPVRLTDSHIQELMDIINQKCTLKVIKDIQINGNTQPSNISC